MGFQLYHSTSIPPPPSSATGDTWQSWANAVTDALNSRTQHAYDVREYGATGDGVTDDTNPISKAFSDASTGGTVFLAPGGDYLVSNISETVDSVHIAGYGATITSTNTLRAAVTISGGGPVTAEGVSIRHQAPTERNGGGYGLRLTSCRDFTIRDVSVYSTTAAGMFMSWSSHGEISGCRVHETLADGIHITNSCSDIHVSGNKVRDTGDDGIATVDLDSSNTAIRNIRIVGNEVARSKSRGIGVIGGVGVVVANNSVLSTKNQGIFLTYDGTTGTRGVQDAVVQGNTIEDANTYDSPSINAAGIDLRSSSATTAVGPAIVIGNTVRGGGWRSINVGASDLAVNDVAVIGNLVFGPNGLNAAGTGIHAIETKNVAIWNNIVSGVSSYGIFVDSSVSGRVIVCNNAIEDANQSGTASIDGINCNNVDKPIIAFNSIGGSGGSIERAVEASNATDAIIFCNSSDNTKFLAAETAGLVWNTSGIDAKFEISTATARFKETHTPASGTASGNTGEIVWDSNYVYVCTSNASWSRATLSTF